ncbi:MAG TPA: DUF2868 domain-containing protein, partial [Albitalea sp.]|uniref:DUF2868 domain-containing protein n=1 Tax=Piscinibacter sp. TaxID=1903157 RepID=UPI002ED54E5D
ALSLPPRLWVVLVAIAFGAGLASDALLNAGRLNLLAPHLWLLLAWNLLVYALVAASAARRPKAPRRGAPVAEGLARLADRLAVLRGPQTAGLDAVRLRFGTDWTAVAHPLHAARAAATLHAAAAAFVLGALVSLYLRGLVFEYRAGWDSTFLAADQVHALLGAVLGPAALLSGLPLPDVDALARMRFSAGGGENAATWIHLFAITLGGLVLLPRTLLSLQAARRAHALAAALPLPDDDPYLQRLLRARCERAVPVRVLPYSYHLDRGLLPGLQLALERRFGAPVAMELADPVALGGEDELPASPPSPAVPVALFALTATPEEENHGAFVQALAQGAAGRQGLVVMVDESGFSRHFAGAEGQARALQRRGAWQRMLQDLGHTPVFVNLAAES